MSTDVTHTATKPTALSRNARRAAVSAFLGSALEYYDFFIYGAAAALVFGRIFFPDAGGAATLLSISTLGVAYVARPLGALLWGHLGDRFGRKDVLIATIVLMGLSTFVIGCLPTYDQAGLVGPIALVALRLLQGISAGGESPGASLLSIEHAPDRRRAFLASFTISGLMFGIALSSVVFIPVAALPDDALLSWGWRIPFLASLPVTIVAYALRRKLEEPEVAIEDRAEPGTVPLVELFRDHWAAVLRVAATATFTMLLTTVNVFGLAYATQVMSIPRAPMLTAIAVASAVAVVTQPLFAMLADRIGRRPVFVTGLIGCGVTIFAFFGAIGTGRIELVLVTAVLLIGICYAMPNSIYSAYFPEQFPARVRYSGTAIGLMVGVVIAGFAPAIAQSLSAGEVTNWVPVALLVCGFMLLSAFGTLLSPETHHVPTVRLGEPSGPLA